MNLMTEKKLLLRRLRAVVLLLAMFLAATAGTSFAAEFFLRADIANKTMPDGTVVQMWGFAQDTSFESLDGTVTVPGPELVVPPGDTGITIHLDNNLPEPVSVVIPGQVAIMVPTWTDGSTGARTSLTQRVRSFTHEAASGNAAPVDYTWTNVRPGTFLYHSGTHPSVQVQMGLYGAVKIDAATNNVYNDPSSAYTNEVMLLYSEIDPALHNSVATGNYGPGQAVTSTIDYNPKYFLVNGEPFAPGNSPLPAGTPGETLLVRFLNAGLQTHIPMLKGHYMTVLAEDGGLYPFPREQYSVLLPALKTIDAVLTPGEAGPIAVYDRALSLTNAAQSPGGMLSFLNVASALQYTLTVTSPIINGTVATASAPGGIDCGTDCTETYNASTQVTLDATPAPGAYFTGWSGGGCSWIGDCVVTMDADKTITASFSTIPPSVLGVFNAGAWSLTGGPGVNVSYSFGLAGDRPVTGDWTGGGTSKIGVFRDGVWLLDANGNGIWDGNLVDLKFKFGRDTDVPVTGDWNASGVSTIGLFRDGAWFLDVNGNGVWDTGVDIRHAKFGRSTDVPVTGDWNGNGTTTVGVYRDGWWYLDVNGNGIWDSGIDAAYKFGRDTDVPVTGDWNGNGTTTVGVYRDGWWYLDVNGNGTWDGGIDLAVSFGQAGDTPVTGAW